MAGGDLRKIFKGTLVEQMPSHAVIPREMIATDITFIIRLLLTIMIWDVEDPLHP
ncbi:uncharacterized protein N7479_000186 [Penicillium vulpinum]|uniref:uncharacterized protein n=1 Tax=Penicillium vulpinum TaxID=29845 RepID=UPI00254921A5|nr:uncharacterized protein N7479_000186 [Penicillium vulpinum]KAJ5970268.1 hypothetical protein N7479_000186 [Penicillium vulpinum]